MKALIHIGMPKTGSSSIQEFLGLNAAALAERGIRYQRFNDWLGSQFELAATGVVNGGWAIRDEPSRQVLRLRTTEDEARYVADYAAFLDARLATWTEPLFVASSEHIQPWLHRRETIQALDSFLCARFDAVRYVIYLRAQDDLLISSYSERIKRGETLTLEEHLAQRIRRLDFNRTVGLWERVLGKERLDVRLMAPGALVDGNLISDFCDVMGTPRAGLEEPGRINTSLSRDETKLRRQLNRWIAVRRRRDGRSNPLYFATLEGLKRLKGCSDAPLTLTQEQRSHIRAYHAESNERLRKRRFPERETLF